MRQTMKQASKTGWLAATTALMAALAGGAQATDRAHTYACEVQTQAGIAGLVMVQADDLDTATQAAEQAEAHTLGGGRSPTMSVIQCIMHNDGKRFRDSHFQKFYENLPK